MRPLHTFNANTLRFRYFTYLNTRIPSISRLAIKGTLKHASTARRTPKMIITKLPKTMVPEFTLTAIINEIQTAIIAVWNAAPITLKTNISILLTLLAFGLPSESASAPAVI